MTTSTTPDERIYAPPMPLPTERFNDRTASPAVEALRGVVAYARRLEGEAREKARSIGVEVEVFGDAPGGADREALNDRVNAYLTEHPTASMDEALRSVDAFAAIPTTDSRGHEVSRVGAPEADRQGQSDALDRYLATHPGASMSEAIAAVERGDA